MAMREDENDTLYAVPKPSWRISLTTGIVCRVGSAVTSDGILKSFHDWRKAQSWPTSVTTAATSRVVRPAATPSRSGGSAPPRGSTTSSPS